jgi:hypothetical protein
MGKRHSPRLQKRYVARIFGLDEAGKPFSIKAETLDVSQTGARLTGVTQFQLPGQTVGLESEGKKSRFQIMWIGRKGSSHEGEVGIRNVEPAKQLWTLPQPKQIADRYKPPHAHDVWHDDQVIKWLEWRNDRRLFYRMPVMAGAKVLHSGIKDTGWGICSDISSSGCFIETMWPLAMNSKVEVVLRLNGREVRAKAVVRSAKPSWGMGLEFTEVSDDDRIFLGSLIKNPRAARAPGR